MKFGDILTYRHTQGTATWTDSEGDYGLINCMGNYLTTKSEGTVLNIFARININKDSFWLVMKRNSSDYELGKEIYLQGKGKFKEYENLECLCCRIK